MISARLILFALVAGTALVSRASDLDAPLPDPLGLEEALRLAGTGVPALIAADAGREAAEADYLAADGLDDTRIDFHGSLRAVEPSYKSDNDDHNDSRARLLLSKRLYDFGYGEALRSAADKGRQASEFELLEARQANVLAVMRAFFDVILSDLEYARDNEAMSVAFIAMDKARDENELGRLSDVELMQLESVYEQTRSQRLISEQSQRLTRSRLAIVMGRPKDLVSEVRMPDIQLSEAAEEDFNTYWERVESAHPRLRALGMRLESAMKQLASARISDRPVLSAELEAGAYNRSSATTHPVGGGLLLEVPLYTGSRKDAAVMRAQADVTSAEAALLEARLQLRQDALESWLERDRLRSDIRTAGVEGDYRELYLDRSRALYDLEVRTDLGDAMTRISEVRVKHARALFDWAINEAGIKAMTGSLLEDEK